MRKGRHGILVIYCYTTNDHKHLLYHISENSLLGASIQGLIRMQPRRWLGLWSQAERLTGKGSVSNLMYMVVGKIPVAH